MTIYSQNNLLWKFKKLGTSLSTIGGYGCAISCLAMLSNRRPDDVNELLKANGGFANQNLVIWARACQLLGLNWQGLSSQPLGIPTIARVSGNGFSQHFVVWLGGNQILDPWDGKQKVNPYRVNGFTNCLPVIPPTPQPAPAPAPRPEYPKNITTTAALNVRIGSGTNFGIYQVLPRGTVCQVVSLSNGWYKTGGGHYISAQYCK